MSKGRKVETFRSRFSILGGKTLEMFGGKEGKENKTASLYKK